MPTVKAFIAIEETMTAALYAQWSKRSQTFLAKLQAHASAGEWSSAHAAVSAWNPKGLVDAVRGKLEELATSALLFGAHNITGSLKETSYMKGADLPSARDTAIDQMIEMLEHDAADAIRKKLHSVLSNFQALDRTVSTQKSDAKALYVRRDLQNGADIQAWAATQGIVSTLPLEDMHVTVLYSKEPVDWHKIPESPLTEVIVSGGIRSMEQFGDAVVIAFESPILQAENAAMMAAGASSDFPTYRSHVTVTYTQPDLSLALMEPYHGVMLFGPEIRQEITKSWDSSALVEEPVKKSDKSLADQLNEAVLTGGKVASSVSANLTTSRLVSFGFLAEAEKVGISTYVVNEVLDGRTCSVCRYMHGKKFSVAQEYGRVFQALSTSDPQELQSIAPWPSQSDAGISSLQSLSLDELQSSGYGSPPYHPGCRGLLSMVGQVEEEIPLGGSYLSAEAISELLSGVSSDGALASVEGVWTEERVAELENAIAALEDPQAKEEAMGAFSSGLYEQAFEVAQAWVGPLAEDVAIWGAEEIEQLMWERFEVTDAQAFKEVDDLITQQDYAKAKDLIDAFVVSKEATLAKAEKPTKKKKKPAQAAPEEPPHTETDYSDISTDSSGIAFDTGTGPDTSF